MRLNTHIIFDELADLDPTLRASDSTKLTLKGVRLVPDGEGSRDYLYAAGPDDLDWIGAHGAIRQVVFSGTADQLDAVCPGWQGIALPGRPGTSDVLALVQRVFDDFDAWEREMLLVLARHGTLRDVLKIGAERLANPIALLDRAEVFVSKGGTVPELTRPSVWNQVLGDGYAHLELLSPDERRRIDGLISDPGRGPFFVHVDAYPNEEELVSTLWRGGELVGFLGSVDVAQPFTLGQASIVRAISDVLEVEIEAGASPMGQTEGLGSLTMRLLVGDAPSEGYVEHSLESMGLANRTFQLAFLLPLRGETFSPSILSSMAIAFGRMAHAAYAGQYADGVVALFSFDEKPGEPTSPAEDRLEERLAPSLEELRLSCGLSMPYKDFLRTRRAFDQASAAVRGRHDEPAAYRFDSVFSDVVLHALSTALPLDRFCDDRLAACLEEGEKGEELLRTLQVYIASGRNVSEAARRLYLHRNTVVYRLEQLSRMLGRDLEDLGSDEQLYLLVSCLALADEHDIDLG